ncbi:MAG: MmgE/PrpD family protein [Chloroflexi bacterium]|nr:MmgE/PrpD family protein [Chloroflexota bacterium]
MDAAIAFAQLAARITYEDLPQDAAEVAKKDILDTIGTILAGSVAEGVAGMAGLVEELGGKPESSVIVHGFRAPSPEAALVNGYMAHCADYDDTFDVGVIHCGAPVIPAALAAAERRGGVSGKELIIAVTLGVELMCRIGLARQEGRWAGGWSGSRIYGYLGAALASARLLGLDHEQTTSALGLAYAQCSGNLQSLKDNVLSRFFDLGCASRGGVLASLVAQRGITGTRNTLEGDCGLFQVYHQGRYDSKPLTDQLGERFEMADLSFKPYPCARPIHPFVDCALALYRDYRIKPEDIVEVVGYVDEEPFIQFSPLEERQNPKTANDGKLSVPYCVAVALVKGAVVLDDFTPKSVTDPRVIAVARKVVPRLDTSLARPKEMPPAVVEVRTKSGTFSRRSEYPLGNPRNPLAMDALAAKFRDCAAHSRVRISEESVSKLADMVSNLEAVRDVAEVIRLVS